MLKTQGSLLPFLLISAAGHLAVFTLGSWPREAVEFGVVSGPSSIEVVVIKEQRIPAEEGKNSEDFFKVISKLHGTGLEQSYENVVTLNDSRFLTVKPEHKKENSVSAPVIDFSAAQSKKEPHTSPAPAFISVEQRGAIIKADPLADLNEAPRYPPLARQKNWEGIVYLKVKVNKDGKTEIVKVEKSSGFTVLDDSASEAVAQWQFSPAKSQNAAFDSWVTIPIQFQLLN